MWNEPSASFFLRALLKAAPGIAIRRDRHFLCSPEEFAAHAAPPCAAFLSRCPLGDWKALTVTL
ncbi:MAG: hypothetical protein ACOYMV_08445, partial [Verrucomicrobiia bacterium]